MRVYVCVCVCESSLVKLELRHYIFPALHLSTGKFVTSGTGVGLISRKKATARYPVHDIYFILHDFTISDGVFFSLLKKPVNLPMDC